MLENQSNLIIFTLDILKIQHSFFGFIFQAHNDIRPHFYVQHFNVNNALAFCPFSVLGFNKQKVRLQTFLSLLIVDVLKLLVIRITQLV